MEQLDKVREVCLKPSDIVTVTTMNHIVEVQHLEKMNQSAKIKKINKNTYMVLETGEIKEFEHIENRSQSYNSLRQTFKKLRYLINNNFVGKPNEIHLTLTYKENMTDTKQLYSDYEKFIKRLRYEYKNLSTIDYINVIEPQARGAWHSHTLLRFNGLDKFYLKNSKIAELWGNGFVTIKSLKDIDNIGAYLSAYLADVELTEENLMAAAREKSVIELKFVEGQEKKFIKGGRLHRYPPGMNLYRKSKGIEPPERQKMQFKNIKKIVGSATPHYQKVIDIDTDDFQNTISYLQYNTKR